MNVVQTNAMSVSSSGVDFDEVEYHNGEILLGKEELERQVRQLREEAYDRERELEFFRKDQERLKGEVKGLVRAMQENEKYCGGYWRGCWGRAGGLGGGTRKQVVIVGWRRVV